MSEKQKAPKSNANRLARVAAAMGLVGAIAAGGALYEHKEQNDSVHDAAAALALPYHTLDVTKVVDGKMKLKEGDQLPGGAPTSLDFSGDASRTEIKITIDSQLTGKAKKAQEKFMHDNRVGTDQPKIVASIDDDPAHPNKFSGAAVPVGRLMGNDNNNDNFYSADELTGALLFPRNGYPDNTKIKLYVENDVSMLGINPAEEDKGQAYLGEIVFRDGEWQNDPTAPQLPDMMNHMKGESGDPSGTLQYMHPDGPTEIVPRD